MNQKRDKFTGNDVCKIFEMTKERYKEMVQRKFIVASQPSKAQGKPAYYNCSDLYDIIYFLYLTDVRGLKRESASRFIEVMRKEPEMIYSLGKTTDRHGTDELWMVITEEMYSFYLVNLTEEDMLKMYEKLKPLREDEPEITDEQYLKAGLRPDHHAILAINTKRLRAIVDARIEKL